MKNNLKAYRKAMGLRQQDVAREVGLSRAAYAHYEKGIREPKLEVLIKIADLFRVTIDDLLDHEGGRDSLKAWELEFVNDMNKLDESSRAKVMETLQHEIRLRFSIAHQERFVIS